MLDIYIYIYEYWWDWSLGWWHTLFCTTNKRHNDGCRTVKQTAACWYLSVLPIPATHGGLTISNLAEPRPEMFYPSFVFVVPHQGVVDPYDSHRGNSYAGKTASFYWIRPQIPVGFANEKFVFLWDVFWNSSMDYNTVLAGTAAQLSRISKPLRSPKHGTKVSKKRSLRGIPYSK